MTTCTLEFKSTYQAHEFAQFLRRRITGLDAAEAAIKRKRTLRPSEKAMWLADINRDYQLCVAVLAQLESQLNFDQMEKK